MTKFHRGDYVRIAELGQDGTVLGELKSDRYMVAVGDLKLSLTARQLSRADPRPPTPGVPKLDPQVSSIISAAQRNRANFQQLDLHGLRIPEGLALVERTIDSAVLADVDFVKVVHGIGSGRMHQAIIELLEAHPQVRSFRSDPRNPGVLLVYL